MMGEHRVVIMRSVPEGFVRFNSDGYQGPQALRSGASQYFEDGAHMQMQVLFRHE